MGREARTGLTHVLVGRHFEASRHIVDGIDNVGIVIVVGRDNGCLDGARMGGIESIIEEVVGFEVGAEETARAQVLIAEGGGEVSPFWLGWTVSGRNGV